MFNPKETAENLRKYGGYIPGIRPGERTAEYIETNINKIHNYWSYVFDYSLFNA